MEAIFEWIITDRVINYSRDSNHQLKFLAELVLWHGIKSQRDKKVTCSNLTQPSFLSRIFNTRYEGGLCCIHTSSPMGSCVRGNDRVLNYSWDSNHQLKLLIELVFWHDIKSQRDKKITDFSLLHCTHISRITKDNLVIKRLLVYACKPLAIG